MKVVVFIDVQNDFIDGALPVDKNKDVTKKIRKYAYICKCEHVPMIATRDTHEKSDSLPESADGTFPEKHVGYLATLEGQKLPIEHCIEGTDGWKLDEGLAEYIPLDNIINKQTFGSINDLPRRLGDIDYSLNNIYGEGITEIELCGFCTDICVIANAVILRATYPNLKISILENLCAGTTLDNHNAALAVAKCNQIEVVNAIV